MEPKPAWEGGKGNRRAAKGQALPPQLSRAHASEAPASHTAPQQPTAVADLSTPNPDRPGSPGRRLFLGDVHGCREELEALLERVAFDPAADQLYPVGDLVNRGPDSLGALRLLKALGAEPVLGNHDLHFLRRARQGVPAKALDTLEELLGAEDLNSLADWLANQPFLRVHGDLFQVHAGISPSWKDPARSLDQAEALAPTPAASFAVSARLCTPAGKPVKSSSNLPGVSAWDEFYDPIQHGQRRVVFGHWAERGLVHSKAVTGLDTGCVWGGALTVWIAEEDRFVAEPARRAHCAISS